MASQNIQHLFSTIRPAQVIQYLTSKGWRCQRSQDRLNFELPATEHSESRQLLLPAEQSHPRFRSLLPNLIFSLSVLEKREALDVANSIADQSPETIETPNTTGQETVPAQTTSSHSQGANAEWTWVLVNANQEQSVSIRTSTTQSTITLAAGHTLQVRAQSNTSCRLHITSDCELDHSGPTPPQLWLGQPDGVEHWRRQGWGVSAGLTNYLQNMVGVAPKQTTVASEGSRETVSSEIVNEIIGAAAWIHRSVAEFVFLAGAETPVTDSAALKRASARLLMQARGEMETSAEPVLADKLFQLARLLMSLGQLAIIADDSSALTLARTMELDKVAAPDKTLEWLSLHARKL